MENIKTLKDALVIKLRVLYDVESELAKALPKISKNATNPDLKNRFNGRLRETKEHIKRLELALELLGVKPGKLKSEAMRGLIKDGQWIIKQKLKKQVLDVMLIGNASYIGHYEMAGYLTALRWAMELCLGDVSELLEATLLEEKASLDKLDLLAEISVDECAM